MKTPKRSTLSNWFKISLLMAPILFSGKAYGQTFSDSACTKYFEITAKLRQGDSLSRETWTTFLKDPAIVAYMADQGVDESYYEAYRKSMQVVYMPQNDAVLQKRLQAPYQNWLTYLIFQYKQNEEGMKAYLKTIEKDPAAYFDQCYKYAYQMLPKKAQKKVPQLTFSIIPIHNDAHAQDNWIIYTLLCSYLNDRNHMGVLGGHELHHVLRPAPAFTVEPGDEATVTALYRILNEGTADMIDKKYTTDTASILLPSQRYFQEFIDEAIKIMPRIDSLLQANNASATPIKAREYFKGTPYSNGHVPGCYMGYYIEKNGFKSDLIKHLDDPFYFFLLYDRAAKADRDKPFRFSEKAMARIKTLSGKYMASQKHQSLK